MDGAGGTATTAGTGGTIGTGGTTTTTTSGCVLLSITPISSGPGDCFEGFSVPGPPASCGVPDGGPLSTALCQELCPPTSSMQMAQSCEISGPITGVAGQAILNCNYGPCATGRRPPGLVPARDYGADPVTRYLGQVAHLEAAAVVAFERLAAELAAHGAPHALVRKARRSAREEVRHACVTRRIAERAGARPEPVSVDAAPALRSIEALAVDNAVEGCVRETFGAVVAMHQAERASDPELGRALETIARDETRHAELSWELARWLDGKLDAAARDRVLRARDAAVGALLGELSAEPDPALVRELGLPTAAQARAAVEDLRASLWS